MHGEQCLRCFLKLLVRMLMMASCLHKDSSSRRGASEFITIVFIIMVVMMMIEGLRMSSRVHEEDRGVRLTGIRVFLHRQLLPHAHSTTDTCTYT